jgi:hypothetical protein
MSWAKFCVNAWFSDSYSPIQSKLGGATIDAVILGGTTAIFITIMFSRKRIVASASEGFHEKKQQKVIEFRRSFTHSSVGELTMFLLSGMELFVLIYIWLNPTDILSKQLPLSALWVSQYVLCFLAFLKRRLILTNEGIEFQSLGGRINGTWNDIAEIFETRQGAKFLLFSTATSTTYFGVKKVANYEIQLSAFEDNWKPSEIEKIIKENADSLHFAEEKIAVTEDIKSMNSNDELEGDEYWKAIRKSIRDNK